MVVISLAIWSGQLLARTSQRPSQAFVQGQGPGLAVIFVPGARSGFSEGPQGVSAPVPKAGRLGKAGRLQASGHVETHSLPIMLHVDCPPGFVMKMHTCILEGIIKHISGVEWWEGNLKIRCKDLLSS